MRGSNIFAPDGTAHPLANTNFQEKKETKQQKNAIFRPENPPFLKKYIRNQDV